MTTKFEVKVSSTAEFTEATQFKDIGELTFFCLPHPPKGNADNVWVKISRTKATCIGSGKKQSFALEGLVYPLQAEATIWFTGGGKL